MTDIPEDVLSIARGCICAKEASRARTPLTVRRIALAIFAERERQAAYIHMLETMNMRGVPSADEAEALDAAMARYDLAAQAQHLDMGYGPALSQDEASDMLARGQTVAG